MNSNRSAMFFTFPKMFELARTAVDKCHEPKSKNALVSIVFSVAALESFVNDSQMLAQMLRSHKESPGPVGALANILNELEESRASIALKYQMARVILAGEVFNKGEPPYQDFSLLLKLRNALVHAGPDKMVLTDSDELQPNKYHELVSQLAERRLCEKPGKPLGSWTGYIEDNPRVAQWSYISALEMIHALFECVPESSFKMVLRNTLKDVLLK